MVCVYCYILKEVRVSQPSSCIAIMDRGVVYSTDKFHVISFDGFTVAGKQMCI